MQLLAFFTGLCALLQIIHCYLFNDKNETEELNRECYKGDEYVQAGNIGQVPWFPWLGILRVHLHERHSLKIAVTGIVLVRDKFAIGNANDVSKIPRGVLRADSQVMFITMKNNPWFCNVLDYMTHPEYEITTLNTVAILELHSKDYKIQPKPICWPTTNFNTNNSLLVIGYTDENQVLEKTVNRVQYIDKAMCSEFYTRSNLSTEEMSDPVNYQCAFDMFSKESCIWENGRVVASNASGLWTLIGIVINGPGCSAPARFLDITAYMPWLITTMSIDDNQDESEDIIMRRSAFGVGFKRKWKKISYTNDISLES